MPDLVAEEQDRRRTAAILVLAVLLSAIIIYFSVGSVALTGIFAGAMLALVVFFYAYRRQYPATVAEDVVTPDWSVTFAAADQADTAIAITDRAGRLTCANSCFSDWFGPQTAPPKMPFEKEDNDRLVEAGRSAWRDGSSETGDLRVGDQCYDAEIQRIGRGEDYLLWRFTPFMQTDIVSEANRMLAGKPGEMLGVSAIMSAVIGREGHVRSANSAFIARATGDAGADITGQDFASFLRSDERNNIFFAREGRSGTAIRLMHIPLADPDMVETGSGRKSPSLIVMIDQDANLQDRATALSYIENLLSMLPFGLAMADRDGRFLFINKSFARASGVEDKSMPAYPSDIVVHEDKAALSDAVHRYASGSASGVSGMRGDVTVRLQSAPEEPVSIKLSGVRGLGDAAVLLSLKDSSEETKLKRQIAQATKMQAVGQLAGGVAHDFNNVLTAIIGHCDLMLMRHAPGDSDYDDIQQIRNNSNRAASLTRQLLAFSRQQTLRPQVLQLPDIVSEVSNLLKRLLGETVKLEVMHDRNLGLVRADPGQLEQVIVNLVVNARDAMLDGGTVTISTRKVTATDVRRMQSEILPIGEYSSLIVADTGSGIAPEHIGKIFEPFFTTKAVGKGTGLGLSTVYGIIKQSGGYIFAESDLGQGTSFVIYLPVHEAREGEPSGQKKEKVRIKENWGSGTLLLVEDEAMVRAVAQRALERQGYTVLTANDGEEGLERLRSNAEIDLVISDVVMPNMDGPKMAEQIRQTYPELPILFMSGYAEEQLRKSIDISNMHFLPKPFSVTQIAEAVQEALTLSGAN
ncbi:response regulator [Sphingorhabdus sp. Alg239-R122]|uniref:hybrid sensor histidine kinase/response regulator n=1 Tax=Sphingorhabdus sp. Alg239-R122 TaxID=2305989 RepID=UPI0013DBE8E6|nr:response regulator [Sphingorhabdus sp. Alg239-R122]